MGPFEKRYNLEAHDSMKVYRAHVYEEVVGYFYFFRKHGGDNMAAKIFDCIMKADRSHLEKFYLGFPEYVVVHEKWLAAESEEEFFKKHGF